LIWAEQRRAYRQHPGEYYLIESANPNVQGIDGAVFSFVEFLHELATV
jgi:hypothetical protein